MSLDEAGYNLHNNSFRIENLGDGRALILFCDPFSGEPLTPNAPPASLERQPDLKEGLDYLRNRAGSLTLTVMGAPHGDADVHNIEELIANFKRHDAIFFEGIGNTQRERDLVWEVAAGNKRGLSTEEASALGSYGVRKAAALLDAQVPTFFADLPADGNQYEEALLKWTHVLDGLRGNPRGRSEDVNLALGINLTGTTIIRDWYMLATIGKQLAILEHAADYRSTKPLLLLGSAHLETLPYKIQALGIRSNLAMATMAERGNDTTSRVDIPFDFVKAVSRCAIEATL